MAIVTFLASINRILASRYGDASTGLDAEGCDELHSQPKPVRQVGLADIHIRERFSSTWQMTVSNKPANATAAPVYMM